MSSGQLSQPEVVPLPQTILGSANAPSLLGQYGTPPCSAALPDGGLHSSFTSPGLASTSNVNVSTPSNSAFDEAVAAAAGHLSRTDDDGGSVTGSSSGDSFLSFASLRATSLGKPGEEDVISLNGSQHKSSVGELPAGSDVPLTDPVSGTPCPRLRCVTSPLCYALVPGSQVRATTWSPPFLVQGGVATALQGPTARTI